MKGTVFLRLLKSADKGASLLESVRAIQRSERLPGLTFIAAPDSFKQVPGAPFAYWVSPQLLALFESDTFQRVGGSVQVGLSTQSDFRFLRLAWEVEPSTIGVEARWVPFAKGGVYSKFHLDIHLLVNWRNGGAEISTYIVERYPYLNGDAGWLTHPESSYFSPGGTYPRTTVKGLNVRTLPRDCIFANKGPGIFAPNGASNFATLAYFNSSLAEHFVLLLTPSRSWEVKSLACIPFLEEIGTDTALAVAAEKIVQIKRSGDVASETTHLFLRPALVSKSVMLLGQALSEWRSGIIAQQRSMMQLQHSINERCFTLLGIGEETRIAMEEAANAPAVGEESNEGVDAVDQTSDEDELTGTEDALARELVSCFLGYAFGRWDIRFATGEKPAPELPDPFAPLPVCPPGQLQNEQGLPITKEEVGRLQAEGQWHYPIEIPWDGILVDDLGHPLDLEARVRQVLQVIWKDRAASIEHEACDILGVRTVRDYFRRPTGFFANHLKRYSKSRRKAPIYWPLSTVSGSYTVWIYYHRLTADTLFQVVVEHLDPRLRKVQEERLQVESSQGRAEGREAAKHAKQAGELAELQQELEGMKAELLRVAELPYKPDLNDGVQITAAPLWKLFRLPKWRKDLEATWKKLENGEYDWAHLSYAIWPERVREKCRTDRSLAIAHELEDLCEVEAAPKRKRGKKANL